MSISLPVSVGLPPCLPVCLSPCLSLSVRWEQFDKKYLSKLLLRKSVYRKSELWEAYQKINIRDAISVIDQVRGGGGGRTEACLKFIYLQLFWSSFEVYLCVCACRVGMC